MEKQIVNILMIDDEEIDFRNLQSDFKKNKIVNPLSVAFNVIDTPDLLRNLIVGGKSVSAPCIILLDISFPEMKGLKLLKWLVKNQEMENIRVFIITSSEDVKKHIAAENYNIEGYIEKPVTFPKFVKAASVLNSSWFLYEQS